ncbi:hypothetical protein EDD29_4207 [Actinocorallia herbida]|uniref:Uncharacterized protein n=1 Tax=Actinocorallia herbida TaxID=58109 RepID=A0A3N1CZB3_9ACTN|nr:hypothetical protein EDD29_4207 [Actinocorallia herbida]
MITAPTVLVMTAVYSAYRLSPEAGGVDGGAVFLVRWFLFRRRVALLRGTKSK